MISHRWSLAHLYAVDDELKRKRQGYLSSDTTLAQYQAIINAVVTDPKAFVYVYRFGEIDYSTMIARIRERSWLVTFGLDGIMETAFPPDEPDEYVASDPRYIPVGIVRDLDP